MEIEDWAIPQLRRFVLLKHQMPALAKRPTHWDLMIDFGEKLLTFEMRELPGNLAAGATQELEITRLTDHRQIYLDFEGPLTADTSGADRGSVARVTAGQATASRARGGTDEHDTTVRFQLSSDELVAEIAVRPCAVNQQIQMKVLQWRWLD